MRPRPRSLLLAAALLAASAVTVTVTASASADRSTESVTQNREIFAPDGSITRTDVTYQVTDTPAPDADVHAAEVTPILDNGPTEEKLDIVVVGDGYTADEMDTYAEHTRSKIDELFGVEPYKSYQDQFNVWMVDVVSNESGVDNDPLGTDRDTALDMYFYCGDIERLLCANDTKANQYAAQAPDVDQVLALANTSTYGGAGGAIATSAGGNEQSGQIVVHELGHTIGHLADEYDYGSGDTYTGPELEEPNVSIQDRATQEAEQTKWHQWMGQETPDGGVIDTYDGAAYWLHGIYRPSENSIMRELGREFNLPGREAMIAGFHDKAAVASAGVPEGTVLDRETTVDITVPDTPGGHEITWQLDGTALTGSTGETSLSLAGIDGLDDSAHTLTVTVVDTTDWVRDEALRADKLTETFSWRL